MGSLGIDRAEVLLISPHPDDEIIGAGATAIKLKKAGFLVTNLAVSLGRPEDHDRRRKELSEACARADFELVIPDEPAAISSGDDLEKAQKIIATWVTDWLEIMNPAIIISPSVHDGHHGHEVVARGVRDSLEQADRTASWWMYQIWGELPYPNVYSPFGAKTLHSATRALRAHSGENARNDYEKMLKAKAGHAAPLGSEKIFGFGASSASPKPYAELFTEVVRKNGAWEYGDARVLNCAEPLASSEPNPLIADWLHQKSPRQLMREYQAAKASSS